MGNYFIRDPDLRRSCEDALLRQRNRDLVSDNWFYPDGQLHTGHPTELLELPLKGEELEAALAREPSVELELALSALFDGWAISKSNYSLVVVHTKLTRRSPLAARAYWGARSSLLGNRLDAPKFPQVFQTLARLELAKLITLGTLHDPR